MHSNEQKREGDLADMANLLFRGGLNTAPLADRRSEFNTRGGEGSWKNLSIRYVRACGTEFSCRMLFARQLTLEKHMRALMEAEPLNELLSLFVASEGSRNCLVVCQEVTPFA